MAEEKDSVKGAAEEAGKKDSKKDRKGGKGKWIAIGVAVLVVSAVLTFPRHWGPWLATEIILGILPSAENYTNELNVEYVGFTEARISNARFGGIPSCPSFEYASVKYSIPGLISKSIDSVAVTGLVFAPEYKVENFSMSVEKHAGPEIVEKDLLQGWKIKSAVVKTGEIDFKSVIPEDAPLISRTANAFCDLKLENGEYRVKGEGVFCGNRFVCGVTYNPDECNGKASAKVFPRLRTASKRKVSSIDVMGEYDITSTNGYGVAAKKINLTVPNSPLVASADLEAGINGISLVVTQPEISLTEHDPLVETALGMAKIPDNVKDISVSARVHSVFRLDIKPDHEPRWRLGVFVPEVSGKVKVDDTDIAVNGVKTFFAMTGIGDHYDILPFRVSYTNAVIKDIGLDSGFASFMLDERELMISEASFGFCDGNVNVYALRLNLERLNSGFTLFIDKLNVGKIIELIPDLKGTASGYLYGSIPLKIMGDGKVRLEKGFLYSPPGDVGNISLEETAKIGEYFGSIGVPKSECDNLSRAFKNLDYSVLRLDLIRRRGEKDQLKILVKGESPQGKVKIPVNLDFTINAEIQTLINYGISAGSMLK